MAGPLRVVVLHRSLVFGGGERVVVEQVRALSSRPCTVDVCLSTRDAPRDLEPEVRAAHPDVRRVDTVPGAFSAFWRLRRGRYDLALVSGNRPGLAALRRVARYAPSRRPATVLTLHTPYPADVRAVRPYLEPVVDVLALSYDFRAAAQATTGFAPDRTCVTRAIFPGLLLPDPAAAADGPQGLRRSLGIPPRSVVLGYFGRMAVNKGVAPLVRATDRLARDGRDVHLVLVGRAEGRGVTKETTTADEIEEAIAGAASLSGRVHRLPPTRPSAALLRSFDLMVLLSSREGMPLSVVEAMSVGTPVLVTAVGGIPPCLRDGVDAALVEKSPDDATPFTSATLVAFEERLRTLVDDEGLRRRLGEGGRARARELVAGADFAGEFLGAVDLALDVGAARTRRRD